LHTGSAGWLRDLDLTLGIARQIKTSEKKRIRGHTERIKLAVKKVRIIASFYLND
jgi:hypothetical protein